MGSIKNYLLSLLAQCSEEQFGQDAIEAALVNGALKLTYNLPTDLHTIFDLRSNCCDAPPQGSGRDAVTCAQCGEGAQFESNFDRFIVAHQKQCREHGDALVAFYRASGIMRGRSVNLTEDLSHPIAKCSEDEPFVL